MVWEQNLEKAKNVPVTIPSLLYPERDPLVARDAGWGKPERVSLR